MLCRFLLGGNATDKAVHVPVKAFFIGGIGRNGHLLHADEDTILEIIFQ